MKTQDVAVLLTAWRASAPAGALEMLTAPLIELAEIAGLYDPAAALDAGPDHAEFADAAVRLAALMVSERPELPAIVALAALADRANLSAPLAA